MNIITGQTSTDDRGRVTFINDFNPSDLGIKRMYMVENHMQGFIRAWHGHLKEDKYVTVVKGAALIKAIQLNDFSNRNPYMLNREHYEDAHISCVISENEPKVLHIPKGYANGFMTLTPDTKVLFYSTSSLEESKGDDFRFNLENNSKHVWEIKQR